MMFWRRPRINPSSVLVVDTTPRATTGGLKIEPMSEPKTLVEKLRYIGGMKQGSFFPSWMVDANFNWGNALSKICNAAADEIERRIPRTFVQGDITTRLRAPMMVVRPVSLEGPTSRSEAVLLEDKVRDDMNEAADEIERLRAARDECERQFQSKVTEIGRLEDELVRMRSLYYAAAVPQIPPMPGPITGG